MPARSRRSLWWTAVALSVLALVAGAVTAVAGYLSVPSPDQVVRSYFDALRAADAPRALGYGRPVSGDTRYLTSAVLAAQQKQAPLGAPTVLAVERSGPAATVRLAYAIGNDSPLTEKITLHRRDRHWLLDAPATVVRLDLGPAARRATLAGLAVPTGPIALFPGAIPIGYDTDRLQLHDGGDRVTFTATGILQASAELSDSGRAAVLSAVRTAMAACLGRTAQALASCPLSPVGQRSVPLSLRGSVAAFSPASGPQLVSDDADGQVEVTGSFSVAGSWQVLDANNLAQPTRGTATVEANARTYVTALNAVSWQDS